MKKSGHGTANWGAQNDEILEGVDLARSGEFRLPHSPEAMGAHKVGPSSRSFTLLPSVAELGAFDVYRQLSISPSSEKDEKEVIPRA
ncbi:hypothetical protein JCM11491_003343 [Sporobolomyces phaffii]